MRGRTWRRRRRRRRYLGRRFRPARPQRRICSAIRAIIATNIPKAPWNRPSRVMPRQELFRQTGIQFMRFNTLFQRSALKHDDSPSARSGRNAAVHARPVPLLLHRRKSQRIHRRQHQSDAQPRYANLGGRPAPCVRPAGVHPGEDRPTGHGARAAASIRGRRDGLDGSQSRRAGDARHSGGGGGAYRPKATLGRTSVRAPGR